MPTATPTKRPAKKLAAPPTKNGKSKASRATLAPAAPTRTRRHPAPPAVEKNKGGRPKIYSTARVQLNTRTAAKTRDRLKTQADRRGVSVSYMVDRALQEGLERWEKEALADH